MVSGVGSGRAVSEIKSCFPELAHRVVAEGFSDSELCSAYKQALAVVIPSKIEGFGLTVVEALSQGATVLCANSPGLRASLRSVPMFNL